MSARIDVALFDQFVKGLGIAETMERARNMYGDVLEVERTLQRTKSETDALVEQEAAWVEQQRKEAVDYLERQAADLAEQKKTAVISEDYTRAAELKQ